MVERNENRAAIILVMFGTSVEQALPGLLNIRVRMASRFPHTAVRIVFTSKIIRELWRERAAAKEYRDAHPGIPEEILQVRSPVEAMRELSAAGIDSLVAQPVHIAPAIEDATYLEEFPKEGENINVPLFARIAVGRPALGCFGSSNYPYPKDIAAVVSSLVGDVEIARQNKAALFYMGHGNRHGRTEEVYREVVREMRRQYPDILTVMSMVEGSPSVRETIAELKRSRVEVVVIKPFMIVAGDHVRKEMVGRGADTAQVLLEKEGVQVIPVVAGLGEISSFADIFVQHAADAARDAGIDMT